MMHLPQDNPDRQARSESGLARVIDGVNQCLLGALLLFMPLAFGAVEAWSQLTALLLAALLLLGLLARQLGRAGGSSLSTRGEGLALRYSLPLLLLVLLAAGQMAPLPASWMSMLSPATLQMKQSLLDDWPGAADRVAVSFYPAATRQGLCLLLLVTVVFLAALDLSRSEARIRRLLWIITGIGVVTGLLALAQDVAGNGKLYWLITTPGQQARSGPFVNHSNFSQFMNVALGSMLALLLVAIAERFAGVRNQSHDHPAPLTRIIHRLSGPEAGLLWCLGSVLVLGVTVVFLSLSRGGMVSLLAAGGLTAGLIAWRGRSHCHGSIMAVLACAMLITIIFLGFEAVYDRMVSLGDVRSWSERADMLRFTLPLLERFWPFGTGLGCFAYVFPMVDQGNNPALAAHLENDWMEWVCEMGWVGVLPLLWALVVLARHYWRCIGKTDRSIYLAGYGLGFGLLAALIGSLFDFGQHLPSNSCLTAVTGALLINLARLKHNDHAGKPVRRFWPALVLAGLLAALAVNLPPAFRAAIAEKQWRQVELARQRHERLGDREQQAWYLYLQDQTARAAALQPDNIHYRYEHLAGRWLYIRQTLAGQADPAFLHSVRSLTADLHALRRDCPSWGYPLLLAGQLEWNVLPEAWQEGCRHILQARMLLPCHPEAQLAAARVEMQQGQMEASARSSKRYIELGGTVAEVAADYLDRQQYPELATMVTLDDPVALYNMVCELLRRETRSDLPQAYRRQLSRARRAAVAELEKKSLDPAMPPAVLAALAQACYQQKEYERAVDYYRRAISGRYNQPAWHVALARTLADMNHVNEAFALARTCLKMWPDSGAARQLVDELSRRQTPLP